MLRNEGHDLVRTFSNHSIISRGGKKHQKSHDDIVVLVRAGSSLCNTGILNQGYTEMFSIGVKVLMKLLPAGGQAGQLSTALLTYKNKPSLRQRLKFFGFSFYYEYSCPCTVLNQFSFLPSYNNNYFLKKLINTLKILFHFGHRTHV